MHEVIGILKRPGLRQACLPVVAVLILCSQALATPTVVTVGPYTLTFYNSGDSDGNASSVRNWTQQQIADVTASASTWTSTLYNTAGRQINLHLLWYNFDGGTLGSTTCPNNGTGLSGASGWTYPEHIWRDGVNYTGPYTGFDCQMKFDTSAAGATGGWNFGIGKPSSTQIDFRSVVTHELGHTVGFYDTYSNATGRWGTGYGTAAGPTASAGYTGLTKWDTLLRDARGDQPANNSRGTPSTFNVTDNPVYWAGTYGNAFYGSPIPIYAPQYFDGGSSLSHLDETLLPTALMSPQLDDGQIVREPSLMEWAMMKDMGWIVTTVWNKGANTLNWSDSGNWNVGGTDVMNHVLFTNDGLAAGDTVLSGTARTIDSLAFDSTLNFTISGGTISLNRGLLSRSSSSSGTQTLAAPIGLIADGVWTVDGTGALVASASITGSGRSLTKKGAGTLVLSGANSYSGNTTVSAGIVSLRSATALGTAAGGTSVADGAALEIQGDVTVAAEGLTLRGAGLGGGVLRSISGANAWGGAVTLAASSTLGVDADSLTITGAVGGANLTKTGGGVLVLSNSANAFGTTTIKQGTLRTGAARVIPATSAVTVTENSDFDLAGFNQTIGSLAGAGGVTLGAAALITGGSNAGTTFSGALSIGAGGTLTKTGSGTMTISGPQNHQDGSTLAVAAGSLLLNSNAGILGQVNPLPNPPSLSIGHTTVAAFGSGAVTFGSAQALAGLTLSGSGRAAVATGGANTIWTSALALSDAGRLDLADNNLIVSYTGDTPLAAIAAWIKQGAGTKDFQGVYNYDGTAGITSAAAQASHLNTALGLRDNGFNLGLGSIPVMTSVDGVPVDLSSVVVKYTYYGDLDLNGKVNVDDYNLFAYYISPSHNPGPTYTTWMTGDLNYDGLINVNDYNLFTYGYSHQDVVLGIDEQIAGLLAPVPEPATLVLLAAGGSILALRRRRSGQRA
jgi:autotransporter-associated beta strand protein